MPVGIPIWKDFRLVLSAHILKLGERRIAVHSNIEPDKFADDTEHVLFVDIDDDGPEGKLSSEDMEEKVRLLKFCWYYRTPKGWHIIDPTRYSFREMLALQLTLGDDISHIRMTARFGRAGLALHPPIDCNIHGKVGISDVSRDHYTFYQIYFAMDGCIDAGSPIHGLLLRTYRRQELKGVLI